MQRQWQRPISSLLGKEMIGGSEKDKHKNKRERK